MSAMLPAAAGILITRPTRQAAELAAAVRQAGGEPVEFPALAIESLTEAEIAAAWADLPRADIVIFISANAVRAALPTIEIPEEAALAAIGPATVAELSERGYAVEIVHPSGFDSEHLLQTPELAADIKGKTVTIVRGEGGRALLGATLAERGATVNYLEVYRRRCPDPDARKRDELLERWETGGVNAVTVLSEATLSNLRHLLGSRGEALLNRTPLVTPSRRVLQNLQDNGYHSRAGLAETPDAATIIAKVAEITAGKDDENLMNESSNEPGRTVEADSGQAHEESAPEEEISETTVETEAIDPENPPAESGSAPKKAKAAPAKRARGSFIGWVALLFSLLALGLSAFLYWQSLNQVSIADALGPLESRIESAHSAANAARRDIESLTGEQRAIGAETSSLAAAIASRQDLIDSLPGRVQNVESSLGAMQGIAAGSRDSWLRAEAEYYMQLANAQLQLARNPGLAAHGLELADERIRQLADPAYTSVRGALAAEIQALKAMSSEDHEGISPQLAGLAQTVALLPLRQEIALPEDIDTPDADAAPTGTKRALAAVKNVLTDLVDVRRTDEALEPLMSPEASYFLRMNLELKFDVARLALLRSEQVDYEQSLDDAASWIGEYFDMESDAVRSALATIADLRDKELSVQFPDIAGSLHLLRQRAALEELGSQ